MSRNSTNENSAKGVGGRGMDILTISAADANKLKIPFAGNTPRPRASLLFLDNRAGNRTENRADSRADPPVCDSVPSLGTLDASGSILRTGPKDQNLKNPEVANNPHNSSFNSSVVIDVRSRQHQSQEGDLPRTVFAVPGFVVPLGYAVFAIGLGLTNSLAPFAATASISSTVCVALSPLLMGSLTVHALAAQSWVSVGLLLCAWLVPSVCASWTLLLAVPYLVVLGVLVAVGSHRMLTSLCLVGLLLSMLLATQTRWVGLEPRWGITLGGFFLTLECVGASIGGGRIVYRIRRDV
jgi:hypothetical protein